MRWKTPLGVLLLIMLAGLWLVLRSPDSRDRGGLADLSHRVSLFQPLGLSSGSRITPAYQKETAATAPEDLEGGDPVQITREVQLAGRANRGKPDPLFKYVYENLAYEPYYGSKRGSFDASLSGAGNDLDQAALLMALFRAAEIPCRFVRGIIEISEVQALNWFRVRKRSALQRILDLQGLPHRWRKDDLQLGHFWVEAMVGERWRSYDPSFKQYRQIPGVDFEEMVRAEARQIDLDSPSDAQNASTQIENWVAAAARRLEQELASDPGLKAVDVFGGFEIIPHSEAPADPYRVVAVLAEHAQLPEELKHKITIRVNDLEFTDTTSNLTRRRTTLHFLGENGQLFPRLLVSNQQAAIGSAVAAGSEQLMDFVFTLPGQKPEKVSKIVRSDSYYALGFDAGTIADREIFFRADIARRIKKGAEEGTLSTDSVFGEILFALAKTYFHKLDKRYQEYSRVSDVLWFRQPSLVVCAITSGGENLAATVDLLRNIVTPVSPDGDSAAERDFMLRAGLAASSFESQVIEELGGDQTISAGKLLESARQAGDPIRSIDAENWASESEQLKVPAALLEEMRREVVDRGRTVLFAGHRLASPVPELETGFVVLDSETYSADFRLGRLNGGAGVINDLLGSLVNLIKGDSPKAKLAKIINSNDYIKALTDLAVQTGSELPVMASLAKGLDSYDKVFTKISLYGATAGYYGIANNSQVNQLIPGNDPCPPKPKPTKPPDPTQPPKPDPCPLPPQQEPLSCLETLKREAMKKIVTDYVGDYLTLAHKAGPKFAGSSGSIVISVVYGLSFKTMTDKIKTRIGCLIDQTMANDPQAIQRLGKVTDIMMVAGVNLRLVELYQKFVINPALFGTPGIVF